MASINKNLVIARCGGQFEEFRKNLEVFLSEVRRFFNIVGENKTSSSGLAVSVL